MDKGQEAWWAAQRGDLETLSRLVREDAGVANWVNPNVRASAPRPTSRRPLPRLRPPTLASAAACPLRLRRRR